MKTERSTSFPDVLATASAFTIASAGTLRTFAANEMVQIAVIGGAEENHYHMKGGLAMQPQIRIVAVAEPWKATRRSAALCAGLANAESAGRSNQQTKPAEYCDYRAMLSAHEKEIDAVLVSMPPRFHRDIIKDVLDIGIPLFCAGILATTIEDCRTIVKRCHETGQFIQMGRPRRYLPNFNAALYEIYVRNAIGRIIHLQGRWHRNNPWRHFLESEYGKDKLILSDEEKALIPDLEKYVNWQVYDEEFGGVAAVLAPHSIDMMNWVMRRLPKRVHGIGGIEYWRDGRTAPDNATLVFEYEVTPGEPGFMPMEARSTLQDKSKINESYTVRFVYTSNLSNSWPGFGETVFGEYGTIELSNSSCRLLGEPYVGKPTTSSSGAGTKDGKGDLNGRELLGNCALKQSEEYQMAAFLKCVRDKGVPRANQISGLQTAACAIASVQSMKENKTIEIDPAWMAFDFETPRGDDFEFDKAQYPCAAA